MKTKVSSDNKEVYGQGSFITFNDNKNIISITRNNETVSFELIFVKDSSGKLEVKITPKGTKQDFILELTLLNFEHPLGSGFTEPVPIAKFDNGDAIYLNLWIKKLATTSPLREIIYTIYVEEKEDGE
ncbi:MAG: hypothetical protein Q8R47_04355 [Nanoarchaeota archaeon]|nr:hypothetical protein [Nanoarchaeota archaeon]